MHHLSLSVMTKPLLLPTLHMLGRAAKRNKFKKRPVSHEIQAFFYTYLQAFGGRNARFKVWWLIVS